MTISMTFAGTSYRALLESLFDLPEQFRPTHHHYAERGRKIPIGDRRAFIEAATERESSFFLRSPAALHDVTAAVGKAPLAYHAYFRGHPEFVRVILTGLAVANPIFGLGCTNEEEEIRNRVKTRVETGSMESSVGWDTNKYIPGLYWMTLMPETLAKKHGVPLSAIDEVALEHVELAHGQHLFRFYDRPEDWQKTDKVAKLCSTTPGIFDVGKVKAELAGVKTWTEHMAVTENWP